jgi:hypothetical protein
MKKIVATAVLAVASVGTANAAVLLSETFDGAYVSPPAGYVTTDSFISPSTLRQYVVKEAVAPIPGHSGTNANVDFIPQTGSFGSFCGGGVGNNCVDLDGTGSDNYAVMLSNYTLNLTAGVTYTLTANMRGNGRVDGSDKVAFGFADPSGTSGVFGADTVFKVASGGTNQYSYQVTDSPNEGSLAPIDRNSDYSLYTLTITPLANIAASIFFQNYSTNGSLGQYSGDNNGIFLTSFQVSDTAPVPLPAAAWLLLSGLGALGAVARRRRNGTPVPAGA